MAPLRGLLTLARWMGPLGGSAAPVTAESVTTVGGVKTRCFGTDGSPLILAPGLHFLGADDVRIRRIGRIFAASGYHVFAPFIDGYLNLRVSKAALEQFDSHTDAVTRNHGPAAIMSFSFGSLMALRVAANFGPSIKRLILFGGLADYIDVMRYSVYGTSALDPSPPPLDPLNRPASFINVGPYLDIDAASMDILCKHWLEFCRMTWGREFFKTNREHVRVAEYLARDVPSGLHPLFFEGTGVSPPRPGIAETMAAAAEDWAHPHTYAGAVRCPVTLLHSESDNVVPKGHAAALAAHLQHVDPEVVILGSFAHGGRNRVDPSAWWGEAKAMFSALRAMAPA